VQHAVNPLIAVDGGFRELLAMRNENQAVRGPRVPHAALLLALENAPELFGGELFAGLNVRIEGHDG
jgi:hypothetical protein